MSKLIRVLIADDSSIMRRTIGQAITMDAGMEIVGSAQDGAEAVACFRAQRPDVVLLDVEMPRVNGYAALKSIREIDKSVPVIMFGSFPAANESLKREALAAGATECAPKPTGVGHIDTVIAFLRSEVVSKIFVLGLRFKKQAANSSDSSGLEVFPQKPPASEPKARERAVSAPASVTSEFHKPIVTKNNGRGNAVHVLAIGASTGGPNALVDVISQLPRNIGIPILIVQHMPPMFTQLLAERLDRSSSLTAREGFDGAILRPGEIWVAPGDFHMTVVRKGNNVVLSTNQNTPENSCRPAVDVLFRSVAEVYGGNSLAVVLTGMGRDGTAGCRALSNCGAGVLAQDEASSVVWGMPRSVVEAGFADSMLSLRDIPPAIMARIHNGQTSSNRADQKTESASRHQQLVPVQS